MEYLYAITIRKVYVHGAGYIFRAGVLSSKKWFKWSVNICICITVLLLAISPALSKEANFNYYNTVGNAKSLGLNITMQYPAWWEVKPGERPHVVVVFSDKSNSGYLASCILLIKKVPLLQRIGFYLSDIEELTKGVVEKNNWSLVKHGKTKIEGIDTGWVIYYVTSERANMKLSAKALMYSFYIDGKYVMLTSMLGGLQNETSDMDKIFNSYLPIFQKIANSIVINNIYD